jgi:flagellar biosynthesis/type III secretory pathway protein FliH
VREEVGAGLSAVRQAHPGVGVIELVDDESLDPLSCVVMSEAGEVRAGIAQQIEAIRQALAAASAAVGAGAR